MSPLYRTASDPFPVPKDYAKLAKELSCKYATPLFILCEDTLRKNCRRFLKTFSVNGRDQVAAYSYKTNNLKALCAVLHREGFGAEVVSPAELKMALELSVPGDKIYYNGPLKTGDSIKCAIEADAAIHVDSLEELQRLFVIRERLGKRARLGFRITPDFQVQSRPVWNKFGLSLTNGEFDEAARQVAEHEKVQLDGLHLHAGTNITDVSVYTKAAGTLSRGLRQLPRSLQQEMNYFDIGGGFSAHSGTIPLDKHLEEWTPLPLETLSACVSDAFDRADSQRRLALVCEPGRVLAQSAMALLTSVIAVKKRSKRSQVIVDAGTNLLPTAYYNNHPVSFVDKENCENEKVVDIHGPLCTQYDLLGTEVNVPQLKAGDLLWVHGVGAYALSFSSQFVAPRPPVVMVSGRQLKLIRQKEPDDVLWKYDKGT